MKLLLTVADPGELPVALAAAPDVLDVKDPDGGSLGRPRDETLERIARELARRSPVPLSVPLGDGPHDREALAVATRSVLAHGPAYVKVGLRGHAEADAVRVLRAARAALAGADRSATASSRAGARSLEGVADPPELVAVTFADATRGEAPRPTELPAIALRGGARWVMLDTLGKGPDGADPGGRSVVDLLGHEGLRRWLASARARGLRTALAGGLDAAAIRRLASLPVDVVGVRGGACAGRRRSARLDPTRCRRIASAVAAASREASARPSAARALEER